MSVESQNLQKKVGIIIMFITKISDLFYHKKKIEKEREKKRISKIMGEVIDLDDDLLYGQPEQYVDLDFEDDQ